MKKSTKIWLSIATLLVFAGLIMFVIVLAEVEWDFDKLNTREYETNIHEINEEFNNISMDMDIADVKFVLANDGKCMIECYEE